MQEIGPNLRAQLMDETKGPTLARIWQQRRIFQRVLPVDIAAEDGIRELMDLTDGVVDGHETGLVAMLKGFHQASLSGCADSHQPGGETDEHPGRMKAMFQAPSLGVGMLAPSMLGRELL